MTKIVRIVCILMVALAGMTAAQASSDRETIATFQAAGQSAGYFSKSYGYAVFPTIGKAGFGIGGAYGDGTVYAQGKKIGETSVTQLSVGFQLGGQAYSQIIFFEDKRALDEFTSGNFEFGANVNAVAITASASADVGTTGASASASGDRHDATTRGSGFYKGMAVFTIAKGGLMYEASVEGQKFTFSREY